MSALTFGPFLDRATIASVKRGQIMVDQRGWPYRVALISGTAAGGEDFIVTIDEALVIAAPERLHPVLREALAAEHV